MFEDYNEAFVNALSAIVELREKAEEIRNRMDEVIESCENLEAEI